MIFHKYLGDSKMFEYDKHYRECQQLNKPFIKSRINPSHGNFYVQIDLMTCNYELSKSEDSGMDEVFQMQKTEANAQFGKFVERNYVDWLNKHLVVRTPPALLPSLTCRPGAWVVPFRILGRLAHHERRGQGSLAPSFRTKLCRFRYLTSLSPITSRKARRAAPPRSCGPSCRQPQ